MPKLQLCVIPENIKHSKYVLLSAGQPCFFHIPPVELPTSEDSLWVLVVWCKVLGHHVPLFVDLFHENIHLVDEKWLTLFKWWCILIEMC